MTKPSPKTKSTPTSKPKFWQKQTFWMTLLVISFAVRVCSDLVFVKHYDTWTLIRVLAWLFLTLSWLFLLISTKRKDKAQ